MFHKLAAFLETKKKKWAKPIPESSDPHDISTIFVSVLREILLRQEASLRQERIPQPITIDLKLAGDEYKLGFSCNLLNNAYGFCKIARKFGINAQLFLDPLFADIHVTSLPEWEEVDFQAKTMPESKRVLPQMKRQSFIREAFWDLGQFDKFPKPFDFDALSRYFDGTSVKVIRNDYVSYLLAYTVIPHRDMLRLYNEVDILHVSGSHIGLASFQEKPYVTFPYGADLCAMPFADSEIGRMQSRGFRKANRHIVGGNVFLEYLSNLGVPKQKIDLLPFMIDTDQCAPLQDNPLRDQLRKGIGDKVLFLIGARQNWIWKGSDKLWRAIAKVVTQTQEAEFISVWYGQDLSPSSRLLKELDLQRYVNKLGILSKKSLFQFIDAADVCIDQFTHGGLGTFALEAMGCAKPLITFFNPDKQFHYEKNPPILSAFSEDEIAERILDCIRQKKDLVRLGTLHREWIKKYHGHEVLWPQYDKVYRRALVDARNSY